MQASARLRTIAGTFLVTCLLWVGGLMWWSGGLALLQQGPAASASRMQTATAQGQLPGQRQVNFRPEQSAQSAPADSPALIIPVQGVQSGQLSDTFTQARENGARVHDAIDIMAPLGTPVLAAAGGTVEKLFTSNAGGLTIYIRCDDRRFVHYYAHLDHYAPGLADGQRVAQGQVIGAVGYTGNANAAGPHLHFAVQLTNPQAKWYEPSTALNPYPMLMRR